MRPVHRWRIGMLASALAGLLLILTVDPSGYGQAEGLPEPPEGQVTIQLDARLLDVPGKVGFFGTVEETERIGTTEILERGEPTPRGARIEDGIVFATPGKFRKYEIVYENTSDRAVTFTTPAFFEWEPATEETYLKMRNACKCASFMFTVPAGGTWLHTAAVTVGPKTTPGGKFVWRWIFVNAVAEE